MISSRSCCAWKSVLLHWDTKRTTICGERFRNLCFVWALRYSKVRKIIIRGVLSPIVSYSIQKVLRPDC